MAASKTNHRTRVGRERSARTETRILEAALGVFASMGPEAARIDDFVAAAGISRGTFYNHFESVDELLNATSEWTTGKTIRAIERALDGVEGPVLRLGLGSRLFLEIARADRVWARFVGRVWQLGGQQLPERDLEEGLRLGVLRAPSLAVARDLWFGTTREALLRIGSQRTSADYGAQITEALLQAVGADPRRVARVLTHELPKMPALDGRASRPAREASSVSMVTERR